DKSITATCPAGKTIVGGGGSASLSLTDKLAIVQSEPGALTAGKATTWVVEAHEVNGTNSSWTVSAKAICATG
ncbi:MAG: hypothetical protein ACRDLN_17505, partial [Solirubrobacteraceae bacterium]